jgi:hypothetical protein
LQVFVGKWNTSGEILAGPTSRVAKLKAVDTYEWLPGGFFLCHRADARMGGQRVQSTEIIGAGARGALATWSFDDQGNVGEYRASLRGGVLEDPRKDRALRWKVQQGPADPDRRLGAAPWLEMDAVDGDHTQPGQVAGAAVARPARRQPADQSSARRSKTAATTRSQSAPANR